MFISVCWNLTSTSSKGNLAQIWDPCGSNFIYVISVKKLWPNYFNKSRIRSFPVRISSDGCVLPEVSLIFGDGAVLLFSKNSTDDSDQPKTLTIYGGALFFPRLSFAPQPIKKCEERLTILHMLPRGLPQEWLPHFHRNYINFLYMCIIVILECFCILKTRFDFNIINLTEKN